MEVSFPALWIRLQQLRRGMIAALAPSAFDPYQCTKTIAFLQVT
jgi:hypothetical protein